MKKLKTGRRAKRSFTPAFKADAVRLVRSGKSASLVAKKLDLTETTLREWAKRADADAGLGSSDVLMTEERAELARLRRENKQLRMERAGSMTMREECSMSPSPTRPPTMASPPTTRTRTPSPTPSSADTKANGRPGCPGRPLSVSVQELRGSG